LKKCRINLFGAVIGFTELSINQTEKGSELRVYLDEVLKADNRAKDLVRQILTFSRQVDQEQNRFKLNPYYDHPTGYSCYSMYGL